MSKWVRLDLNSIRIYKDDVCICKYNYDESTGTGTHEWLIPMDERPTEQIPITVSIVKADDYSLGGSDVEGNTNGIIYKIIWQVKDDTILVSDRYSLVYEVILDYDEEGFQTGQIYPTNGNTIAEYTDTKGIPQNDSITVPSVISKKQLSSSNINNNNTEDSIVTAENTPVNTQTQNIIDTPKTGDEQFNKLIILIVLSIIVLTSTFIIEKKK